MSVYRNCDEFYLRQGTLSPETVDAMVANLLRATYAGEGVDSLQLLEDLQDL